MKKIDLPLILDVLFYTACAWFVSVGILRYARVSLPISLLCASLIALSAGGGAFLVLFLRRRKHALGRMERQKKDVLMLHMALEKERKVEELLMEALRRDGKDAAYGEDGPVSEGAPLCALFSMEPASADAIASLLRDRGGPFTLACNTLSPDAIKLAHSFEINIMDGDEIYELFERTKTTPETLICGKIPRKNRRAVLKRIVSKKNARPFFTCGLFLLAMSLFSIFPLYYLISGCVLVFCALTIRMIGYA